MGKTIGFLKMHLSWQGEFWDTLCLAGLALPYLALCLLQCCQGERLSHTKDPLVLLGENSEPFEHGDIIRQLQAPRKLPPCRGAGAGSFHAEVQGQAPSMQGCRAGTFHAEVQGRAAENLSTTLCTRP